MKPVRLFVSDIDGTLLGNPESVTVFASNWSALSADTRPALVYSTGRLADDTRDVVRRTGLPSPDYIVCGVGTQIYDENKGVPLKAFHEILEDGWDLRVVREILSGFPVQSQPKQFQTPYKCSYFWSDATEEDVVRLETALADAGLDVHVVYSSNRDLDILPLHANKGNALRWLSSHLEIPLDEILAAGDSGNDAAMLKLPGVRGIVVENAQPELMEATVHGTVKGSIFQATGVAAEGVLQGLVHFGVLESVSKEPHPAPATERFEPPLQQIIRLEDCPPEEMDEEYLHLAREKAVEGLHRCVTPMGFTACSILDNSTRGTDANYHSVWGRDGAVTLLGSLHLEDETLRDAQRNTLITLVEHISPNGQFPANVHVESGEPDYSGVGGICSIDSGLWILIAFYEYVRHTRELDLLRKYRGALQHAMNWLSAHDSNNDGLLEIPEAGDWTDLFGRSYNVLYDEVLWYRANVCYGRLMEMAGDEKMAGDYLRWSGFIRSAILDKFWPATSRSHDANPATFADKQFSLGDTNYLVAQVTPFNFDWRCDVLGNLMAFLYNVLDETRAKIAFRFMWGAGVADPWPAANLYPVVSAGDPMWKDYYTVNLLNLPNHYHNGGIWPFVGGFWVRFIHRLGLTDLARRELHRLAQANQQGVSGEWEFNEWLHGQTGKPMGKAHQAWSCSEYLAAHKVVCGW